MAQPICTVMVGLPGLGKSTIVKNSWKDPHTFVYSIDNYIEKEMVEEGYETYDEAFEHMIGDATSYMNAELEKFIKWKNDVIWDQTNLGINKRRKIIDRMKEAGYQIRCVCIMPPNNDYSGDKEDWAHRLNNRTGKTVPQDVLTKMIEGFIVPTMEEGFDMITFYNMHGALLGIDYGEEE